MNRSVWKWVLAVSLSINLGVIATIVQKQIRTSPEMTATAEKQVSLPDRLQLTQEQRQRWLEIERTFLADIAANWRDIRVQREALVRQIFSAQPDRARIDAQQAKIAALQDAQQRRVVTQLLAERELLDESQRVALMELLLNRYTEEASQEERLHQH